MSKVVSLIPWFAYAIAGFLVTDQWAASAAAVASVGMLLVLLTRGRRPADLVIELASTVYFIGYAAVSLLNHGASTVSRWLGPTSQAWLAAVVAAGMLLRRPFTLALASRRVPASVAQSDTFFRFNMQLTRIWLIAFLASGLILLASALTHHGSIWLSICCIALTMLIPSLIMHRLAAGAQASEAA